MADKMIRNAGKTPSNKAKAMVVNEQGHQIVEVNNRGETQKARLVDKNGNTIFDSANPGHVTVDNLPDIQKSRPVDGNGESIGIQSNPAEVNVNNQRDDYPDSAALNELQTLKSDVAETKKTQADILSKLNGTLDTQLTGSNVEEDNPIPIKKMLTDSLNLGASDLNLKDVVVPPGSYRDSKYFFTNGKSTFGYQISFDKSTDVSIRILGALGDFDSSINLYDSEYNGVTYPKQIEPISFVSNRIGIRVKNNGSEEITIKNVGLVIV